MIQLFNSHWEMVYSTLFSLLLKIIIWPLRRILSQTPLGSRARELEEFGTSLWRSHTLLRLRKNNWGNHRDRSSVQSFSLLQSLFWSLDQKRRRRNFRKWVGPLRNGREPIFVTIPLPEFISGQAVRLASSKFWEVVSIFKGRHRFNRSIKNGKRHVRIFPAGGDPALLPKKIYFHENIQRDALFTEKVVLRYRCKTRYMLGENCPAITPTQKDSSMSFTEQSGTLSQNQNPIQPDPSAEILPCVELSNNFLLRWRMWLGEIILRRLLIQIRTLYQNQSHTLTLVHTVSLDLGRWLLWKNPLSHLQKKPYLRILKIRPVWEGLLHRCQIHTSEGEPSAWHFFQTSTKFLEKY